MSNHQWCRDVQRDEAIRAAEDAAAVPAIQHRDLPEAVAALTERVARLEAVTNPRLGSESVTPTDGLRTEMVTLEVTHHYAEPLARWLLGALDSVLNGPGENVFVMDSSHEIARLTAERDEAKKECERLRAKIVAMEGQSRMETEAEIAVEEAWERCGIAPYWPDDEPGTSHRYAKSMEAEIVRLRARVAELEAAAAVRPMGWIARHEQSPPVGKYVMCRWDVSACPGYAREVGYGVAKRGPDGMWSAPNGVEKIAPMHWMPLLPGVEGGDAWEAPLASAPAANAGGEQQEPVAWVATQSRDDGGYQRCLGWDRHKVIHGIDLDSSSHPVSVSPLYAAPPPPRGWLTAEEREEVQRARAELLSGTAGYDNELVNEKRRRAGVLTALLARSSPPRVKTPPVNAAWVDFLHERDGKWRDAIRAAGGEVE